MNHLQWLLEPARQSRHQPERPLSQSTFCDASSSPLGTAPARYQEAPQPDFFNYLQPQCVPLQHTRQQKSHNRSDHATVQSHRQPHPDRADNNPDESSLESAPISSFLGSPVTLLIYTLSGSSGNLQIATPLTTLCFSDEEKKDS